MTDKTASKAVKPPIGIKPRHLHDIIRIEEIHKAMGRYIEAGKQIPAEWAKEMLDLSKSTFSK